MNTKKVFCVYEVFQIDISAFLNSRILIRSEYHSQ